MAKEGSVSSTKYYVFAFEVECETAECIKFVKRESTVYKAVKEESFAIGFFVSGRLESTELAALMV